MASSNPRIKEARKLSRRPERSGRRLFLADGPKAVEAALTVPGCVAEVYATVDATSSYAELRAAADAQSVPWALVDQRAMAGLSDSVTPAGVVAICRFLDVSVAKVVEGARLVAICADIRDPGNAGTVIRCVDAAGADGVVLAGSSVDAYNPKTVRASVGSLFHLPLAVEPSAEAAVLAARGSGLTVLAADGAGEVDLFDAGPLLDGPVAWLFGNEAWGLPSELASLADHRVSIPIRGRAESLNLSTAAALCLYESARHQGA